MGGKGLIERDKSEISVRRPFALETMRVLWLTVSFLHVSVKPGES